MKEITKITLKILGIISVLSIPTWAVVAICLHSFDINYAVPNFTTCAIAVSSILFTVAVYFASSHTSFADKHIYDIGAINKELLLDFKGDVEEFLDIVFGSFWVVVFFSIASLIGVVDFELSVNSHTISATVDFSLLSAISTAFGLIFMARMVWIIVTRRKWLIEVIKMARKAR